MRTSQLLCTALLTVGACCAYPQYGPPKQEEEQQIAVVAEPLGPELQAGGDAGGEFWWQNQGVFTGENPGGTVVVIHEQNSKPHSQTQDELAASPFIPSPSPDCAEFHGCIPWQYCIDGVFTNTGEGLLALRTPTKVPETYTQQLCGQIGNICCLIPEPILAAQQQGQSGGSGPYSGGDSGDFPAGGALPVSGALIGDGAIPAGGALSGGAHPVGDALPAGGVLPADGSFPAGGIGILDALRPAIIDVISTGETIGALPVVDQTGGAFNAGVDAVAPGVEQVSGGVGPLVDPVVGSLVDPAVDPSGPILEQVSNGDGGYGGALKPAISDVISTGETIGALPVVDQTGGAFNAGVDAVAPGVEQVSGGIGPLVDPVVGSLVDPAVDPSGPILEQVSDSDGGYGGALKPAISDVISTGEKIGALPAVDQTGGAFNAGVDAVAPGVEQVSGGVGPLVDPVVGSLVDPAVDPSGPILEQVSDGDGGYGGGVREDIDQQAEGSVGIIDITESGCPAYTHDCVPYFQCIDGEINTSGIGLIDVRILPLKECTNPEYPEVPGICCKIPGATPPPFDPTPAPIKDCVGTEVCVDESQCNYDGTVNTDGAGLINTRLRNTCYTSWVDASTYETGICCHPPAPVIPAPLVTCPGTEVCVIQGQCLSQASVTAEYNAAAVTNCFYTPDQAVVGECCDALPVPVLPEPLDPCPITHECVEQYQCNSDGTINTDGAGLINTRVYSKPCYIDSVNYVKGICCKPPAPPVPEPLVTCPGIDICLSVDECTSQTAVGAATGSSYTPCILDSASYTTGVCCESSSRTIEVCPGSSVCIPDILCQGDILTNTDQYKPYGSTGDWTWSQCLISGDISSPGVCCRNPEPVVDPSPPYPGTSVAPLNPYNVADTCGVRNYGLDLRAQVKLAKNEAQFGEFPWQAIIFFTNYTFKCGASLVEDKWLITAAHCVDRYKYGDFSIRLGEWQVDKYDEPLKYVDVDIASITIHPDFKPGPVHNDIALIELKAPVTLQYHINSVCLPSLGQKPDPGTRCFASGWGKDAFEGNFQAILKKVDVPYVDHAYCQDLLRKTRLGKYFILDDSFMCAGGEENIDACEGDGGGPLVCKDEVAGTYYLAGITAWGIDCGQKDVPGVYADVQLFKPWIESIIYGQAAEQLEQQVSSGAYGRK